MRKLIFAILCFSIFFCGQTAYAGGEKTCDNSNFWNAVANECSPHTIDTDTHADRDDPAGVGIDVLIHETDSFDFVAEYKRDFNNNENSIFGVIKTKKSLVELIKGFFNKGE